MDKKSFGRGVLETQKARREFILLSIGEGKKLVD